MNLLADEGVDRPIVDRLRQDGHTVTYVLEMEPGVDDDAVLNRANAHMALLLTQDKDFGELVFRQGSVHFGVVLIRLAGVSPRLKAAVVSKVLSERAAQVANSFTVVSAGRVRIRKQSAKATPGDHSSSRL